MIFSLFVEYFINKYKKLYIFHDIRFDVSNGNIEKVTSEVLTNIKEIRPQSIGTGVYVWNEVFVSNAFQRMAKQLKLEQKPFIILGGPQITYSFKGMNRNKC
jgi:hypothetical protein